MRRPAVLQARVWRVKGPSNLCVWSRVSVNSSAAVMSMRVMCQRVSGPSVHLGLDITRCIWMLNTSSKMCPEVGKLDFFLPKRAQAGVVCRLGQGTRVTLACPLPIVPLCACLDRSRCRPSVGTVGVTGVQLFYLPARPSSTLRWWMSSDAYLESAWASSSCGFSSGKMRTRACYKHLHPRAPLTLLAHVCLQLRRCV